MKKLFAVLAAVAAISGPAAAADLPSTKGPVMAPVYSFTWTGFYVGAQIGGGWGDTNVVPPPAPLPFSHDISGILGGLHAGYNWQTGALVFGVEGDIEAAGLNGNGNDPANLINVRTRVNWLGSARLRLGYANNNWLFYLTGGAAFGGTRSTITILPAGPIDRSSDTAFGYTVGAGLEYAWNNNWSSRIEYRYTDLGRSTYSCAAAGGCPGGTYTGDTQFHAVRLGVSYRW